MRCSTIRMKKKQRFALDSRIGGSVPLLCVWSAWEIVYAAALDNVTVHISSSITNYFVSAYSECVCNYALQHGNNHKWTLEHWNIGYCAMWWALLMWSVIRIIRSGISCFACLWLVNVACIIWSCCKYNSRLNDFLLVFFSGGRDHIWLQPHLASV